MVKSRATIFAAIMLFPFLAFSYPSLPFCQTKFFGGNQFGASLITSNYQAVEVMATLRVDSLWHLYDQMQGNIYGKRLSVVSVAKVDTTIFTNSGSRWNNSSASQFSWDTSLFNRTFVDSATGEWQGVARGDTLKDVFVLQENYPDRNRCFWTIVDGACAYLVDSKPPFPLQNALAAFNSYLNKNNLYRGYNPPAGPLELGPLFLFLGGDVGWRLRAYCDANDWFVEHQIGEDDCPAGCIVEITTLYKVTSAGIVSVVDSNCGSYGCGSGILKREPAKRTGISHSMVLAGSEGYDIRGRRVTGLRASVNNNVPSGVYFIRGKDNGLVRMFIGCEK
jgi:hypothetical protein